MSYFDKVESLYPSLSKSEKKVADYIKNNGEKVVFMSIRDISNEIDVGDATVVRFYKKIGYNGFQDLKLDLVKEDFKDLYEKTDNFINEIGINYKSIIESTLSLINQENIEKFVKKLSQSKRIYLYGVGTSGLAAKEAENNFFRAGIFTKAIIDNHFQILNSSMQNSKTMIIAYSLSGNTEELLYALKLAKKNNAYIVAITNYPLSPIGEIADLVFTTAKKETILEGGSLGGKVSQILISDILCTAYSIKRKKEYNEIRKKTAEVIISRKIR